MTTRLAIIPARGGSKRLPRKNLLPFNGKPMLAHPIAACRESGLFDRIIVSTDDTEIAAAAQAAGAEIMDRPNKLATDRSSVAEVCTDLPKRLADDGYEPEVFCCAFATAVFVTAKDLKASRALLDQPPPADIVLGVSAFNLQPHQAMFEENGLLKPMWPDLLRRKSQALPGFVASNGTFSWVRTQRFIDAGNFPLEPMRGYEMSRLRTVDIDTAEDYAFALAISQTDASTNEI